MKHASVTEARKLQEEGYTYVDVRSTREFAQGHPDGAVNIPLMEPDEDTGQMMPNPDFVRVMQANYPPDSPLLIGCQAGGRSMRAAQMLESFGYQNLTNVKGGFRGARDPLGRTIDPGWVESNLPVEEDVPADRSWQGLSDKADRAK